MSSSTTSSLTIPHDLLAQAALSVHALLTRNGLAHVFLGGFELALLGFDRGSKDIDVEVEKPFFKGFEKVRDAFRADPSFAVFDGSRHDGVCILVLAFHSPTDDLFRFALYGDRPLGLISSCGTALPLSTFSPIESLTHVIPPHSPGRFSKNPIPLSVTLPPNPNGPFLPFLSHTSLLIEKIKCSGERNKSVDAHDVMYIVRALGHSIDMRKVRKSVSEEEIRCAVAHHPSLSGLFDSLWVA